MPSSPSPSVAFDALGRELNARALRESEPGSWSFALAPGGLDHQALQRVLSLPGTHRKAHETAPRERLQTSAGELRALARDDQAAACLLAAREGLERPTSPARVMGVLNVTPDSFSDGGRFESVELAVQRAHEMIAEGAAILDIGGESTRPGAAPVSAEQELQRVLPVIEVLARETEVPLSIDTTKSEVARRALEAGCRLVNDISGGRFDERILAVTAQYEATFVCMHSRGRPETMQQDVAYEDPTAEICAELRDRVQACLNAGVGLHKIVLDPGIGFGKRLDDNLDVQRRLSELRSLGLPLLLGVSRKSFIGQVNAREGFPERDASDRVGGTAAAVCHGAREGAEIFRVHDVATMAEALRVAHALQVPLTRT